MYNKKIIIGLFIGIILILTNSSYASVEIVSSRDGKGKDAITRTTISNSYLLCQGMKNSGESLEGTTVLPHLATNKDWGAVSYLSNSVYGTNTAGENTGVKIQIDGINYYSTNGNVTGVMNWGANPNMHLVTQTAGIGKDYDNNTSLYKDNVTEIYNNIDTRYVEKIDATKTEGMAMGETIGMFGVGSCDYTGGQIGVSVRYGLFKANFGRSYANNGTLKIGSSGLSDSNITFRPVIWNN